MMTFGIDRSLEEEENTIIKTMKFRENKLLLVSFIERYSTIYSVQHLTSWNMYYIKCYGTHSEWFISFCPKCQNLRNFYLNSTLWQRKRITKSTIINHDDRYDGNAVSGVVFVCVWTSNKSELKFNLLCCYSFSLLALFNFTNNIFLSLSISHTYVCPIDEWQTFFEWLRWDSEIVDWIFYYIKMR